MNAQSVDKLEVTPPCYGLVYGDIVYWLSLAGMVISVIGAVLCGLGVTQFADSKVLLKGLWSGAKASEIWEQASGRTIEGHWYLRHLFTADGLSMFGVALCSAASIVGMWGACAVMLRGGERREKPLFIVLAFVVAVILSISITGMFSE